MCIYLFLYNYFSQFNSHKHNLLSSKVKYCIPNYFTNKCSCLKKTKESTWKGLGCRQWYYMQKKKGGYQWPEPGIVFPGKVNLLSGSSSCWYWEKVWSQMTVTCRKHGCRHELAVQNVTEHKEIQQRLRGSLHRHHKTVSKIQVGRWAVGPRKICLQIAEIQTTDRGRISPWETI